MPYWDKSESNVPSVSFELTASWAKCVALLLGKHASTTVCEVAKAVVRNAKPETQLALRTLPGTRWGKVEGREIGQKRL